MMVRLHHRYAALLIAAAATLLTVVFVAHLSQRPTVAVKTQTEKLEPSLNCAFYDFMHAHIIVGFDFAVAFPNGSEPRFEERAEGSGDSAPTTFDADHRPVWAYGHDDDGTPMITSPDGATRIVLYGLKLNTGGALFIEAGIRSNDYRNLGGECRQVSFDSSGHVDK